MSRFFFRVPSITCLGIIVRYNGPDFLRTPGRCSSHSLFSNFTRSLSPLSLDHICWGKRRVGFLVPHCLVFVGFSWILPPCSHLPFGKCWNLRHKPRNGLVSLWSLAHRLGEIVEIYVCQGHCVFQVCPLPRKLLGLFRCMAVIYLGVYLFPGEAVSLLRRVLLATLWTHDRLYDAHWIVLVMKIAIYGCLHYSQRVGLVVCTIFRPYFNVKLVY